MSEPTLYQSNPNGDESHEIEYLVTVGVLVPVEPDHEAMAEALWESETPVLGFEQPWADQPEVTKDEYREAARRVWRAGVGDTDEGR